MNYKELKEIYNLTSKKMSEIFGFKTEVAYRNSSAKKRYEDSVVKLFEIFKDQTAVNVRTFEEFEYVVNRISFKFPKKIWEEYGENTCLSLHNNWHGNVNSLAKLNYDIISFEDFKKRY